MSNLYRFASFREEMALRAMRDAGAAFHISFKVLVSSKRRPVPEIRALALWFASEMSTARQHELAKLCGLHENTVSRCIADVRAKVIARHLGTVTRLAAIVQHARRPIGLALREAVAG